MSDNDPIILCHAACSGGSLIFRVLCAQFGLAGISEKAHNFPYDKNVFLPTDPEHALLASGVIDLSEFAEIFVARVLHAIEICSRKGLRVLIREHTHSYFFQEDGIEQPTPEAHPSWLAVKLSAKSETLPRSIVTVRDPIDSWLGLQRHFPRLVPKSFDAYCTSYLKFIESTMEATKKRTVLMVRYEDFVEKPLEELDRVAHFIGMPFDGALTSNWGTVVSSGNSGRQSQQIRRRKRRAIDLRLLREANTSTSYQKLIGSLGYPSLNDASSFARKVMAPLVQAERYGATTVVALRNAVGRWARGKSYVRPR